MTQRPWLVPVWERTFATEDEADEFWEYVQDAYASPLDPDRVDGHTIRIYLDKRVMESRAQLVEASFEPATLACYCRCGHVAAAHTMRSDGDCGVHQCPCEAFERDTEQEG